MELKTISYKHSEISVNNSPEQITFKNDIEISNIIYLFYKDNECLYVGETSNTLHDRCYKNSPKHFGQEWFREANMIHIIKLDVLPDNTANNMARQAIESIFILAYRPKYNKKA